MKEKLQQILLDAKSQLEGDLDAQKLEEFRQEFLGKKGKITEVLRGMGALSAEERPIIGQIANSLRAEIDELLAAKKESIRLAEIEKKLRTEKVDVTMPGELPQVGHRHPLETVKLEMCDIFRSMGFDIVEGPEVEFDYYNFEALNIPENHPARDTQDTFYINPKILLRSQTSSVQVRVMEKTEPPIRVVSPGRVYRSDELDATHSPMFHQLEGLVVDKNITMGDLKGTLEIFAKNMFGPETKLRFRPHHFRFTEPSAEVDVSCFVCNGDGSDKNGNPCKVCKGEGWIEILGAGMVHPNVLRACNIDPDIYSGFAFGMGIERIAMRKFNIDDLRKFFENDLRFLSQF